MPKQRPVAGPRCAANSRTSTGWCRAHFAGSRSNSGPGRRARHVPDSRRKAETIRSRAKLAPAAGGLERSRGGDLLLTRLLGVTAPPEQPAGKEVA
jgi:hypothetical protein